MRGAAKLPSSVHENVDNIVPRDVDLGSLLEDRQSECILNFSH